MPEFAAPLSGHPGPALAAAPGLGLAARHTGRPGLAGLQGLCALAGFVGRSLTGPKPAVGSGPQSMSCSRAEKHSFLSLRPS